MLCVRFRLGDQDYAIPVSRVIEVLPYLNLRLVPRSPAWVAGTMSYHGTIVPVIDLCALHLGRRTRRRVGSRIMLVRFQRRAGASALLGLLAEQVTDTLRVDAGAWQSSGLRMEATRHLDGLVWLDGRQVQRVEIDELLSEQAQQALFDEEIAEP